MLDASHPLSPFHELLGGPFGWGGSFASTPAGTGYALALAPARAAAAAQKNGAGDYTGLDDGLLIAHGLKGGQGQSRSAGAPLVLGHGFKADSGGAHLLGHPHLLVLGEKVVVTAIGYGLVYAHGRALAQGAKAVSSFASSRDHARGEVRGQKGGEGHTFTHDYPDLFSLGEHGGEFYFTNRGLAFDLARGLKIGAGSGLTRGVPHLIVFGVKVGGGTAGEGFGLLRGHAFLDALGLKGGDGIGLLDGEARLIARAIKSGVGDALARALPFLEIEGLHGGQALNIDPGFVLTHGAKSGAGLANTLAHGRLLASGSRIIVIFPPHIIDEFPRMWWIVDE